MVLRELNLEWPNGIYFDVPSYRKVDLFPKREERQDLGRLGGLWSGPSSGVIISGNRKEKIGIFH
jgi:hypothetical protein